jgi:flavin-dependent dehydrogenase
LKQYGTIEEMQNKILKQNPFLKESLEKATFLYDAPKVINEISFARKTLIENDLLMCGDAAGMIAPLCGNGMAIAIHSAKILSTLLIQYFDKQIDKPTLFAKYQSEWNKHFKFRLALGRTVQRFFGSSLLSEIMVRFFKNSDFLARQLVKQTHGEIF